MGSLAKTTIKKISASQKALGEKTGFIGATVFYDVGSEATVTLDTLSDHFDASGLSYSYLPNLPSPRKVFAYVIQRGAVGVGDAQVIRISSEPTHDIWGVYPLNITGEDKPVMDRNVELGEPLAKIGFFPENPQNPAESLVVAQENGVTTQTPSNPVAAHIISEWNRRKDLFTNPDISEMIRSTLKRFGRIRLKQSGHVYFVPAARLDELQKLRDVIDLIGGDGTHMDIVPAANHPEGIATIQANAQKGFEEDIKVLREKVREFKDSTRESTKEKTVDEALELKAQLELYRDISEDLVVSLQKDADNLVDELRGLMGVS
jgi:hypothetical protein